jgi:hypothetical protein
VFGWIKNHKKLTLGLVLVIFVFLSIIMPLGINLLFKMWSNDLLSWEQDAGDVLQFYAAFLSFISTVIFSTLAYLQNKLVKEEADKREKFMDKLRQPQFRFSLNNTANADEMFTLIIKNISENAAYNLKVRNIETSLNETALWNLVELENIDNLKEGEKCSIQSNIQLSSLYQSEKTFSVCYDFMFTDRFASKHTYHVVFECKTPKGALLTYDYDYDYSEVNPHAKEIAPAKDSNLH